MPTITEIVPQKNNKERFTVFLDGKYGFAVSAEVLVLYKLKEGQELSDGNVREIVQEENTDKIYNKILNFLSYRNRSQKEVEDRLREYLYKASIGEDSAEEIFKRTLVRLGKIGLVDDSEFVKAVVEDARSSNIPKGKRKISDFLLKKGISRQQIEDALAQYSYEEELQGALKELEKKLKTAKVEKNYQTKHKMWQFLARKGYSLDVINAAVDSNFEV